MVVTAPAKLWVGGNMSKERDRKSELTSGRHIKFLNGIETTRIEIFVT